MTRFQIATIAWAVVLALGFVIVFTLGRPLPSEAELLDAAFHPTAPVTQAAAEASAATIIRIQYSDLATYTPTVSRRTDFGVDRWVIVYASNGPLLNGAQISVAIASGQVEVATFP